MYHTHTYTDTRGIETDTLLESCFIKNTLNREVLINAIGLNSEINKVLVFFFWKLNNEFDSSIVLSSKCRSKSFKEFCQQVDYKIKFKSESFWMSDEFIS